MKYQINQNNYHTFEIFEVNKMAPRSYFIPYPDRAQADAVSAKEKRYASPKVLCLNGDWDFKFYPGALTLSSIKNRPASFTSLPVSTRLLNVMVSSGTAILR